jgi:hypothetical protein
MGSEMSEALGELMDANDEVHGGEEYVMLNGRKLRALVSDIPTDPFNVGGGTAESGTFTVTIPFDSIASEPENGTPVKARGKDLVVLSCVNANGVAWEITAGDPTAES